MSPIGLLIAGDEEEVSRVLRMVLAESFQERNLLKPGRADERREPDPLLVGKGDGEAYEARETQSDLKGGRHPTQTARKVRKDQMSASGDGHQSRM